MDFENLNILDIICLLIFHIDIDNKFQTNFKFKLEYLSNKYYFDENLLKYYEVNLVLQTFESTPSVIISIVDISYLFTLKNLKAQKNYQKDYVAGIVHDMKAPLHGILGFLEKLEFRFEEKNDKTAVNDIQIIKGNSEHLQMLISDILESTRLEKRKFTLMKERFSLKKLFKDCALILKTIIRNKNIKVYYELEYDIEVNNDYHRLKRILLNLLTNAKKFTLKGKIGLEARFKNNLMEISVVDTGVGIPYAKLKKLFKPFNSYQDASGTLNKEGIGLGLVLTQKLVNILGPSQKINVNSTIGEGSRFTFLIFWDIDKKNNLKNPINQEKNNKVKK